MNENMGLTLCNAARIISETGPQIDALRDDINKLLTERINEVGIYKTKGESIYELKESEGDWLCVSLFLNIPLVQKTAGRRSISHHIAIQATIYDESESDLDNWEPAVSVLFGNGKEDEPFEINSMLHSSYNSIETINDDNLKVIRNKLLTWSTEDEKGWMFTVPLVKLNPENLMQQIIDPAISLMNEENTDTVFSNDSLAFNFEISDGKLKIIP